MPDNMYSSESNNILDLQSWLQEVGFVAHPFEQLAADQTFDIDIEAYFEPFPFFEEIIKPKCTFLFLNRGMGKSTSRVILEKRCEDSLKTDQAILAVPYIDFHELIKKEGEVTLEDHIQAILRQAVPKLYDVIIETRRGRLVQGLPEEYKKDLAWFVQKYSQRLNPRSVARQIYRIQGLSEEERKELLKAVTKVGTQALTEVAKSMLPGVQLLAGVADVLAGIQLSDDDDLKQIYHHSPLDLMARFAEIAEALDMKHIYILVDRVDEYAQIHQFPKAANMLKSLVEAIPLLEMSPYAFKFFLPLELRDDLTQHLRSDRFDVYTYHWHKKDLGTLLETRLAAFYDDKIQGEERISFLRLFESEANKRVPDIVEEILEYANASPRNLLKLAKTIIDEHTRIPPIDLFITQETYTRALSQFAQEQIRWRALDTPSIDKLSRLKLAGRQTLLDLIKRDLKPSESADSIRRRLSIWENSDKFYAPHFSLIDIVEALGEPAVEARKIAQTWEEAGLISIHYRLIDESLAQYLYASTEEEQDGR